MVVSSDSDDSSTDTSTNVSSDASDGSMSTDDDFKDSKRTPCKKRKTQTNSSSESRSKPSTSTSDDDDVEITEVHTLPSSQRRRNIRDIKSKRQLSINTLAADVMERGRKKRYKEMQSMYNEYVLVDEEKEDGLKQVILQRDPLVEVDKNLVEYLHEHQARALHILWINLVEHTSQVAKGGSGSGAMIAHYMGLGKTFTSIALLHTFFMYENLLGFKRFMLVVPKNVLENWRFEWRKWMSKTDSSPKDYTLHDQKSRDRLSTVKRWHKRGGVLIIGYHLLTKLVLSKEATAEEYSYHLLDPGPDIVVCDEAHLMKNDSTQLYNVLCSIKTQRRVVLTGTPLQNRLIEYHTMVSFIKPNFLGTQREFKNRFANPIENGQKADSVRKDVKVMQKRVFILNRKMESFVDRQDDAYLKKGLPPKQNYIINVRLSDEQVKFYRAFLASLGVENMSSMSDDMQNELLRQNDFSTKILQHRYVFQYICCHPTLLKKQKQIHQKKSIHHPGELNGQSIAPKSKAFDCLTLPLLDAVGQRRSEEEEALLAASQSVAQAQWWVDLYDESRAYDASISNKLLILLHLIDACSDIGDKVVVFSSSVVALDFIEKILRRPWPFKQRCQQYDRWDRDRDYCVLTGKTTISERLALTNRFNKESNTRLRLFLISVKAGGVGMNLWGANRVIILDPSWNPTDEMQALGRSYRIGQKKPTYVYRLVGAGTAEEHLYKRQVDKETLALRVVDEQQQTRHYTHRELSEFYVFEHKPYVESEEPSVLPPSDRLFADVLKAAPQCVRNYHMHDHMLMNRPEEELTEEEVKEAWKEYEEENKRYEMAQKAMEQAKNKPPPSTNQQDLSEKTNQLLNGFGLGNLPVGVVAQYLPQHPVLSTTQGLIPGLMDNFPNWSEEQQRVFNRLVPEIRPAPNGAYKQTKNVNANLSSVGCVPEGLGQPSSTRGPPPAHQMTRIENLSNLGRTDLNNWRANVQPMGAHSGPHSHIDVMPLLVQFRQEYRGQLDRLCSDGLIMTNDELIQKYRIIYDKILVEVLKANRSLTPQEQRTLAIIKVRELLTHINNI